MANRSKSKSVDEPLRAFVATALTARLEWPKNRDGKSFLTNLAGAGSAAVSVLGTDGRNTLPFHLNVNARVGHNPSPTRVRQTFSASIKFGGSVQGDKAGRVPVAKLDWNHGGAHLHPFERKLGICTPTELARERLIWLPWYAPSTVYEAFLTVLYIFFKEGAKDAGLDQNLEFVRIPPEAGNLQLVV